MNDASEHPSSSWPAMSIAAAHALLTAPGAPFEMETAAIRGVPRGCGRTPRPAARRGGDCPAHGERIFLVHEDERVSFEAFFRAVSALAHELRRQSVVKGDRVAIACATCPSGPWPSMPPLLWARS